MRAFRSVVVSSALLFILGAGGVHPVSGAVTIPGAVLDGTSPSLVIAEFYPCAANGDEYLVLSNRGSEAVNLFNWSVSDGEGAIRFLGGVLLPGQTLSMSENASSYASVYGRPPDITVVDWMSGGGVEVSGRFRLADSGDALELVSPDGATADVVVFGSAAPPASGWYSDPVPALRTGEVALRLPSEGSLDTDTADDWTHFREFRYGYSDHAVVSSDVSAGCVTSFTSPDCSLESVLEVLSGAEHAIMLCSYELSSSSVCRCLSDAFVRGVNVRVLVDALPVGGMSLAEVSCLSSMASDGVDVRVLGGDLEDGVVRHVGALHAKYIVVDDEIMVALSENFVEDGVPVDRLFGNRGWGVSVKDPVIASFMSSVFDDDSRLDRPDVWPWLEDPRCDLDATLPGEVQSQHLVGMMEPRANSATASVSVHISPDASAEGPFIVPLISAARNVKFEQFQAESVWSTRWSDEPVLNPIVDAIGGVLREGGDVQGIFDGSWYNIDGNTAVVSSLSAMALESGAAPSFTLMPEESPITIMHNKGLILDESTIISSNNWVYASFAKNREMAVEVRSDEVVSYFSFAFGLDWTLDTRAPVADAGDDVVLAGPGEVVLDASGSWDDRAVADVSWDIDCDGRADASGYKVTFVAEDPGTYDVWVEVEDAWGNTATDSITVTVGPSGATDWQAETIASRIPWALPAALSALVVSIAVARKLNLLRGSSRGKG